MSSVFSLPFRLATRLVVAVAVLLLPIAVFAQGSGKASSGTGGIHVIQGYVFFPSGRRAEASITVRLESYSSSELLVTPDSSGAFTFSALSPGNYTVVVNAGKDYEIARESVFIDTDVNPSRTGGAQVPTTPRRFTVMVHLQLKRNSDSRIKPGVIDAALAAVPESARKKYEKGMEFAIAGHSDKAIQSLKEAIALYPDFPLALNELGVQYLKFGQPERAVAALRNATRLSPEAFLPMLNFGIALLQVREFSEAEKNLRSAVKRNTNSPTAHMYLGVSLLHGNNYEEAERELLLAVNSSGNQLGLAQYYLGGLYWKQQQYPKAIGALETYLRLTPHAADADRVRSTIKDLKARSGQ
jgi:tetratricopeptide (TPR) repeat protein